MEEWDFLARSERGLPVSHCGVRRLMPAQVSTNWLTILLCVMNKQIFLREIELIWIYLPRYRLCRCFNLSSLHCQSGWVGLALNFCPCRQNLEWLLQAFWPWEGQIQLNIMREKELKWSLTPVHGVVAIAKMMEATLLQLLRAGLTNASDSLLRSISTAEMNVCSNFLFPAQNMNWGRKGDLGKKS